MFIQQILIGIFSIIGGVFVWMGTSLYGAGLFSDSVCYISAARNLLSGDGYLMQQGLIPMASWPPLFSTILALFGLIGIDPLNGARLVNTVAFGLIIFASGQLFKQYLKSNILIILGTITILLSPPLFNISVIARAEPLFIFLVIMFMVYLTNFISQQRKSSLFFLSFFAMLACLQRYMGITLILSGIISLLFICPGKNIVQRVRYVLVFVAISGTPITLWMIRNFVHTKTLTGGHIPAMNSLVKNIYDAFNIIMRWFWPGGILPFLLVSAILVFMYFEIIKNDRVSRKILSVAVFMVIYFLSLIAYASILKLDDLSDRLLSPLVVFLFLFIFIGLDKISKNKIKSRVFIFIFILWLIYPAVRIFRYVSEYKHFGAGGYNTSVYHKSRLIQRLADRPLQGYIFSNEPNALYILCGIHNGGISLNRSKMIADYPKFLDPQNKNYLVWIDINKEDGRYSYLYEPKELALLLKMDNLEQFFDGAIYEFK